MTFAVGALFSAVRIEQLPHAVDDDACDDYGRNGEGRHRRRTTAPSRTTVPICREITETVATLPLLRRRCLPPRRTSKQSFPSYSQRRLLTRRFFRRLVAKR